MDLLERSTELAALEGALSDVCSSGRGSLVLVAGEAGIGKTALLDAFCDGKSGRKPNEPRSRALSDGFRFRRGRPKNHGRLRRDLANHFDTGICPFKIHYGLIPNLSGFRFPGDKMENVLLRERLRCFADKKKSEENDEGSHENPSDE